MSFTAPNIGASPTSERRLLWKIDLLLMPLMTIAYGLQFYDKAILASASIFGILKDLDLAVVHPGKPPKTSLERYSTATSAFYWGYLVAALPMALLVQRFRPNIFLGCAIVLWGIIVILTPSIGSWKGLIAQRFWLGAVESAVSPGFLLITRSWYKRSEQPLRLGIWYSATGLFSIFSGLVNYGLGKAGTRSSAKLPAWKYMFLFAGSLTILFGAVMLLLLPSGPIGDAILKIPGYNSFSPEEKSLAAGRLRTNITGESDDDASTLRASEEHHKQDYIDHELKSIEASATTLPTAGLKDKFASLNVSAATSGIRQRWNFAQIREALMDYKIYIFFLQAISIYICNGGVTAFGAYIIRSFGYTSLRSIILQTPGGATTAISIYLSTIIVLKVKNSRSALLILTCLPVIVGAAMIWKGDWTNRAVPLAGYYLLPIFGAPFVLMLSLSTANVAGATKQSITSAFVFAGYNVGNIVAPYLTLASEASIHYRRTFVAIITCMAITILLTLILDAGLWYQNKSRRQAREVEGKSKDEVNEIKKRAILEDWTDWQNPYFEYAY
ncbi:related to DAL5 - Allantoate and ureidosuccinate permease [Melanopsichium pennsylvanicum]|uniref:Related to DAL5 - Allantoate and ureidosuccinate permease n=2 Tax=Melanopsichium pennsylvanicum TaxID=63383 RepID=A0AAJ4XSH3_9BASI|nr:related to DAL5-Allantoate and ureidosuccinate permease [Melanopsichium pennsylvanicum 4]SNX87101.1 related to DAL5 - Allantoate and ureidosuccinate permease [Melanopsichium pennsylvanicum]